jgi:hypothetical protein
MLIPLLLIYGVAGMVHADLYKYRDHSGRLVISNQPPPDGAAVDTHLPSGTPPAASIPLTPLREADTPLQQPWRTDHPAAPISRPQDSPLAVHRTTPVDTNELGFITDGMSEAEVQRRLGTPARVVDLGTVFRVLRDRRDTRYGTVAGPDATAVPVTRTQWVYPGNSRVGDAVITFHNGEVDRAKRVR